MEALRAEAWESETSLSYRDAAWKTDEDGGASGGQLGWKRKREHVGVLLLLLQPWHWKQPSRHDWMYRAPACSSMLLHPTTSLLCVTS